LVKPLKLIILTKGNEGSWYGFHGAQWQSFDFGRKVPLACHAANIS
jgi:hypothetical protein